jgi:hypothetical protein
MIGVGRPQGSFCFRGPILAESVRRSGLWTSGRSASDGGTDAGAAAAEALARQRRAKERRGYRSGVTP